MIVVNSMPPGVSITPNRNGITNTYSIQFAMYLNGYTGLHSLHVGGSGLFL